MVSRLCWFQKIKQTLGLAVVKCSKHKKLKVFSLISNVWLMMTMLMKRMIINVKRFTGSLDKGYHHTELMVYTHQHMGDIPDSTGLQCKHWEEDVTDGGERDRS